MFEFFQIIYWQIGPIKIYTWGLFAALGFLFGFYLVRRDWLKVLSENQSFNLLIILLFGSLAGARLSYIIQFLNYFASRPLEIIDLKQGGLAFYGGLAGAVLTAWWYARHLKLSKSKILFLLDATAPALALGLFFGRLGCSLINDHLGAATNLPWGIVYLDGLARQPVAEYLVISNLILLFILVGLRRRISLGEGKIALVFLSLYSLIRFSLDFTRARDLAALSDPLVGGLFFSQWVSLFLFTVCLFLYFKFFYRSGNR